MPKKLRQKIHAMKRHVSKIKRRVKRYHRKEKPHGWGEGYKCRKCGDIFPTTLDLQFHVNEIHNRKPALREIRLLEQGFIPEESKLGMPFKGKNKVIIA